MAIEIERKFLVSNDGWRQHITSSIHIIQGYLGGNKNSSVRIRVYDDKADINIKSRVIGSERNEYEYAVPLADAKEMLEQLCDKPLLEKTRHYAEHAGHVLEIDEFAGENAGLVIAEIELGSANESISLPDWLGTEVTGDASYYNICLVTNPYSRWNPA